MLEEHTHVFQVTHFRAGQQRTQLLNEDLVRCVDKQTRSPLLGLFGGGDGIGDQIHDDVFIVAANDETLESRRGLERLDLQAGCAEARLDFAIHAVEGLSVAPEQIEIPGATMTDHEPGQGAPTDERP